MSVIMGTSRGRYGSKLMSGQSVSVKYPGFIDCGQGVYRKPSIWRDKSGRERSSNYYFVEKTCAHCEKPALANRTNAARGRTFCSEGCKVERRRIEAAGRLVIKKREHGEGHHVLVKTYDHPRSGRANQVYEHILVADKKIGRLIDPIERVHHINLIKSDNTPDNLFVCANDAEHFKIHGSLNRCVADLIGMGVLRFDPEAKAYVVVKQ
jgi:endogenous inhibitor of DNA gyrase (YacG/DUF329 family)